MANTIIDRKPQLVQIVSTDSSNPRPLVVDLDGTFVKTDLQLECLLALLKRKPRYCFSLPRWLVGGKKHFAEQLASQNVLDVHLLPYRVEVVDYLKAQRAQGRTIVLAAKNNAKLAQQLSDYLMVFDMVFVDENANSLSGEIERDRLVEKFGERGFDYATSGRQSMAILSSAQEVILVNPSVKTKSLAVTALRVERIFENRKRRPSDYLVPLRPQHWLKNLLAFVPMLAAHRFYEMDLLVRSLAAFIALCCCASSGYLFNDLFDLAADRRHPSKRFRAFAAGELPLSYALTMIPSLAGVGFGLGLLISPLLAGMLFGYLVLTLTYSLYIKNVVLLDVIVLAGLYTLRIMVGSAAVAIWPSHWLLAFSMFLFLSLALIKRYSELVIMQKIDGDGAKARSYELGDAELLASKGTASAYLAVFVLALYITSGPAGSFYGRHELMWFLCPLLLYWIGRMWLIAHRGKMSDDPVVFAITDTISRILILLMIATAALAL